MNALTTSRGQRGAARVLVSLWLAGAGLVGGFCLGGLVGPTLLGSLGGHGLGDLGYLFGGGLAGAVAGAALGVVGSGRWTAAWQVRVAAGATLVALLLVGAVAALGW